MGSEVPQTNIAGEAPVQGSTIATARGGRRRQPDLMLGSTAKYSGWKIFPIC
jgi:hypothetical protein